MEPSLAAGRASDALCSFVFAGSRYGAAVVDGLFSAMSDADLLAELREREQLWRRQATTDHRLLAELGRRGVPTRLGMPSVSAMLQAMLLLSPYEARQRVAAAEVAGPRISLTGDPLGPKWPRLAAAQADGTLSIEQARVIAQILHRIPLSVAPTEFDTAELSLVHAAGSLPPRQLGQLGERILAYLNPDGVLAAESEQQRLRSLSLIRNSDGTYDLRGHLTSTCGALVQALLSAHSAPRPSADGPPDPRSHSQRMHDALELIAGFQIRRTELIDSGGAVQIVITMTAEQFHSQSGWAETSFGQLIPADVALALADEAALTLLVRDAHGAVLAQGHTKPIATRSQTLALIARDRGCSFPDCDKPPEWTQRHHIRPWSAGGRTDVDNLTLLCGRHHRNFERQGWRVVLRRGLPWWIPPPWIDPEQTPRLNARIRQ